MVKRRRNSGTSSNQNKTKLLRSHSVGSVDLNTHVVSMDQSQGGSKSQQPGGLSRYDATDPACKTCNKPTAFNIFEVNSVQCCFCRSVHHGSCLDIDESLLPFLYVIKEVGGWCCPTCQSTQQPTANKSKGKGSVQPNFSQPTLDQITT